MNQTLPASQTRWARAREQLRKKFSNLTDEDLEFVDGREEAMLETIARKTGRTREAIVDAFSAVGMFRAGAEP